MAGRGINFSRRDQIKRALRRAKEGDRLKLEDLAAIWGVVKTRFVNVRGNMENTTGFPTPIPDGNIFLYPAKEALQAMWAYETRDDAIDKQRNKKLDRILGRGEKAKGKGGEIFTLSIGEMAQASRLAAEIEEREREQGLFVPVADVAQAAGDVFSLFAEVLDDLDNRLDPNGILPADVRDRTRELGAELLLKVHAEMKDMLSGNARARSSQPSGLRRAARRSR